jgi:hypothetical protein
VGELVDQMERRWGKQYDRAALRSLYGDLGSSAIAATLARGKPHEQAVAMYIAGERADGQLLRPIAQALVHPYPLVRYYARAALARIAGRPCPIDLDQDDTEIARQAEAWLR